MALIGTASGQEKSNAGLNFYVDGRDSSQTSIIQQLGTSPCDGKIEGATWSSEGGGSWYFDGTNDRVVFGSDGTTATQTDSNHYYEYMHDYVAGGHGQCVVDAWIKPSTSGAGAPILAKRTDNNGWPIIDFRVHSVNSFDMDCSAGGYGGSLMYSRANDNVISTGTWYHVGWSFCQRVGSGGSSNSYSNRTLWLNGVKITTNKTVYGSDKNDLTISNRPFTMGNIADGSSWVNSYFHGYIAIVRLYSCSKGSSTKRWLFNENIIKQHYDSERSRFGV